MEILIIWIVFGLIGAAIGQSRGRTNAGFWWGLFLGPLGWLIVILGPNPKQEKEVAERTAQARQVQEMQERHLAELRALRESISNTKAAKKEVEEDAYWVRLKDKDLGPIGKLELIELYSAGKIDLDTQVARESESGHVYKTLSDEIPALKRIRPIQPVEQRCLESPAPPMARKDETQPPPYRPAPAPTKKRVEKSLTRPLVTILVLLFAHAGLMIFIFPVFAAMFADFGAKLPAMTQFMIDWSNLYRHFPLLIFAAPFAVVFGPFALLDSYSGRVKARRWLLISAALIVLLFLMILAAVILPIFQLGAVAGGLK